MNDFCEKVDVLTAELRYSRVLLGYQSNTDAPEALHFAAINLIEKLDILGGMVGVDKAKEDWNKWLENKTEEVWLDSLEGQFEEAFKHLK